MELRKGGQIMTTLETKINPTSNETPSFNQSLNVPGIDRDRLLSVQNNTPLTSRQHVERLWAIWNEPNKSTLNAARDLINYISGNRDDYCPPKGGWVDRMDPMEEYIETKVPLEQRNDVYKLLDNESTQNPLTIGKHTIYVDVIRELTPLHWVRRTFQEQDGMDKK
jgi:hypothetical protein